MRLFHAKFAELRMTDNATNQWRNAAGIMYGEFVTLMFPEIVILPMSEIIISEDYPGLARLEEVCK